MKANICKDRDRPGCLGTPDPRYIMRFDDIGKDPILFCAHCGPEALAIDEAIQKAFIERPGFAEDFKNAIEKHSGSKILSDGTLIEGRPGVGGIQAPEILDGPDGRGHQG